MHRVVRPALAGIVVVLSVLLIVAAMPVLAGDAEVTGVRLPDHDTLAWDAVDGAIGYHVYRNDVERLDSGPGDCRFGSITGRSVAIPEDPEPGRAFSYLVSAFDGDGEGPLGTSSAGDPRVPPDPCVPARRLLPVEPNGIAADGVADGQLPCLNGALVDPGCSTKAGIDVGIVPATGELVATAVDLAVPGRGIDFALERTYRSQVDHDGPLGHNWFSPLFEQLRPGDGNDVVHCDGTGRCETFTGTATGYVSPPGRFAELHAKDGRWALRGPGGTIRWFHGFDGSNLAGVLEEIEDRLGNRQSFLYDDRGLLATVVDTMGRSIELDWNDEGRLVSVSDFAGREVRYGYDDAGDLVSVRSPVVTGTPNGNDFPDGKTVRYAYSADPDRPRLAHDLRTIADGTGTVFLENVYGSKEDDGSGSLEFDRVLSTVVGSGEVGGTTSFAYEALNAGGGGGLPDLPRRRATITSPGGIVTVSESNENAHELTHVVQQRHGRGEWRTERRFDMDGRLLQVDLPGGGTVLYSWDVDAPDRYRQGDLLEERVQADPDRGDGHGGTATDIVRTFEHEPFYGELLKFTGPKGNDPSYVPPNGGDWSAARYTETRWYDWQEGDPDETGLADYAREWGITWSPDTIPVDRGDLNGDDVVDGTRGLPVRREAPTVHLEADSHQAAEEGDTLQEVVSTWRWNECAQPVSATDPAGVETTWSWHPETDPDGDGETTPAPADGRELSGACGGYLAGVHRGDLVPVESCTWSPTGLPERIVDGRGVLTVRVHNALGQLVEVRAAAATRDQAGPDGDPPTKVGEKGLEAPSYKTRWEWDAADRLVRVSREDRGKTRGVGEWIETRIEHDVLGRVVRVERDVTSSSTATWRTAWDRDGNPVRWTSPEGIVTTAGWDERGLLVRLTRGAEGPGGGSPAVTTWTRDADGNVTRREDPAGYLVDWERDGFGRVARIVDEIGGVTELTRDPAGDVVRVRILGVPGGVRPTGRDGSDNVLLASSEWRYDELGRLFRVDRELFVPDGVTTSRPVDIVEGSLVPGDGAVNHRYEHDAAGRQTFETDDHGATTRYDWNAGGLLAAVTLPDGSRLERWYDAVGNLVEAERTDLPSAGGAGVGHIATWFLDALGRVEMVVDDIGRTDRFGWDSLGGRTLHSDADGPEGGTIHRRSPEHATETVAINGHGNVTKWSLDGLGRVVRFTRILAASGHGDGTTDPKPDTSNPWNPSGLIEVTSSWDLDSRLVSRTDPRGFETTFAWDRLDRLVTETWPDGTRTTREYDPRGFVRQVTLPGGTTITATFCPAGTITRIDVTRADGIEGTTREEFEYDGLGRPTRASDDNNPSNPDDDAISWRAYDSLGRLVEERQQLPSLGVVRPVDYAWEAETLLTRLTTPDGRTLEYAHDAAGRLTSVQDPGVAGAIASFDWLGMDLLAGGSAGTGISHQVTRDEAGRVTSLEVRSSGLLRAGYRETWKPTWLQAQREMHDASGDALDGERFARDSARRLDRARKGYLYDDLSLLGDPADEVTWTLDAAGLSPRVERLGTTFGATPNNLEVYDENQSGGTSGDDGLADDFHDDLSTPTADGRNFAHDLAGNQVKSGSLQFRWDAFGRLVRVLDGDALVSRYKYDAFDRLVGRVVKGAEGDADYRRACYRALGRAIEERDGTDAVAMRLGLRDDGLPLWQESGGGTLLHRVYDPRGNVVALLDPSGIVRERVGYDALGVPHFETADNAVKTDAAGAFLRRSDFGLEDLWAGRRYLWELGERGTDRKHDWGGAYLSAVGLYDPNQGGPMGTGIPLEAARFDLPGDPAVVITARRVVKFRPGSDLSDKVKSAAAPWFDPIVGEDDDYYDDACRRGVKFRPGSELADKVKSAAAPWFDPIVGEDDDYDDAPGYGSFGRVVLAAPGLRKGIVKFRPGSELANSVKGAAGDGNVVKFRPGSDLSDKVKSAAVGGNVVKFRPGSELADKVKSAAAPWFDPIVGEDDDYDDACRCSPGYEEDPFGSFGGLILVVPGAGHDVVKFKPGSDLSNTVKSASAAGRAVRFRPGSELADKVKSALAVPGCKFKPGSDLAETVKSADAGGILAGDPHVVEEHGHGWKFLAGPGKGCCCRKRPGRIKY